MNIVIFKSLTTEENLIEIEKQAEKYVGFHMEMEDKPQRKIVKDSASVINTMLKKIERARIDLNAERKAELELECAAIVVRLKKANEPFTLLIDDYKEARAKILAAKKAAEDAKQLAIQIEQDHADAITLDKMRTFEIEDEIRQRKEHDEKIAKEARENAEREQVLAEERAEQAESDRIVAEAQAKRDAKQAEINRVNVEKQAEINRIEAEGYAKLQAKQAAEYARQVEIKRQADEKERLESEKTKLESDKKHAGSVRCEIKKHLMTSCKIDEPLAKEIVLALLKIDRITINY